ncbi:hypothetical protein HDU88_006845 [Geranomyces variabilis]|nr:hypothetical protein HDU88_006845 [Geranomyces variabilis]
MVNDDHLNEQASLELPGLLVAQSLFPVTPTRQTNADAAQPLPTPPASVQKQHKAANTQRRQIDEPLVHPVLDLTQVAMPDATQNKLVVPVPTPSASPRSGSPTLWAPVFFKNRPSASDLGIQPAKRAKTDQDTAKVTFGTTDGRQTIQQTDNLTGKILIADRGKLTQNKPASTITAASVAAFSSIQKKKAIATRSTRAKGKGPATTSIDTQGAGSSSRATFDDSPAGRATRKQIRSASLQKYVDNTEQRRRKRQKKKTFEIPDSEGNRKPIKEMVADAGIAILRITKKNTVNKYKVVPNADIADDLAKKGPKLLLLSDQPWHTGADNLLYNKSKTAMAYCFVQLRRVVKLIASYRQDGRVWSLLFADAAPSQHDGEPDDTDTDTDTDDTDEDETDTDDTDEDDTDTDDTDEDETETDDTDEDEDEDQVDEANDNHPGHADDNEHVVDNNYEDDDNDIYDEVNNHMLANYADGNVLEDANDDNLLSGGDEFLTNKEDADFNRDNYDEYLKQTKYARSHCSDKKYRKLVLAVLKDIEAKFPETTVISTVGRYAQRAAAKVGRNFDHHAIHPSASWYLKKYQATFFRDMRALFVAIMGPESQAVKQDLDAVTLTYAKRFSLTRKQRAHCRARILAQHAVKDGQGRSLLAMKGAAAAHAAKDEKGRSLLAMKKHAAKDDQGRSLLAMKNITAAHDVKDSQGRSLFSMKGAAAAHAAKDDRGKSLLGMKNAARQHAIKDEKGRSLFSMKGAAAAHAAKDNQGRSLLAMKNITAAHDVKDGQGRSLFSMKGAAAAHAVKDDQGRSLLAMKNAARQHAIKDEKGRSLFTMKANAVVHAAKDDQGRSLNAMKAAAVAHAAKDDQGRSLTALKAAAATHAAKDGQGRSLTAVKASMATHAAKDDQGKSLNAIQKATRQHAIKDEKGRSLLAIAASTATHARKDEEGKSLAGIKAWENALKPRYEAMQSKLDSEEFFTEFKARTGVEPANFAEHVKAVYCKARPVTDWLALAEPILWLNNNYKGWKVRHGDKFNRTNHILIIYRKSNLAAADGPEKEARIAEIQNKATNHKGKWTDFYKQFK